MPPSLCSPVLFACLVASAAVAEPLLAKKRIGHTAPVGCDANAKRVQRLEIAKPGVYENHLVDGEWLGSNLVKIINGAC